MGQEVASGQFVQTWRQRTESKRLDKLSQTAEREETMLRKIRRFYWKQRDRGLGRQTVMAAVGAALFLMIILGAVTKNVIMPKNESQKNVARTETASGTAIGAEPASGGGVAIENIETGIESEGEKTDSTAVIQIMMCL